MLCGPEKIPKDFVSPFHFRLKRTSSYGRTWRSYRPNIPVALNSGSLWIIPQQVPSQFWVSQHQGLAPVGFSFRWNHPPWHCWAPKSVCRDAVVSWPFPSGSCSPVRGRNGCAAEAGCVSLDTFPRAFLGLPTSGLCTPCQHGSGVTVLCSSPLQVGPTARAL